MQHAKQERHRKEFVYGAVGVALAAALVFGWIRHRHREALRDEVRTFYTAWRDTDEAPIAQFWQCITRSTKIPKDNVELEAALDSAIARSAGGYARYAREKCLPELAKTPGRLEALSAASVMSATWSDYVAAVRALSKDAEGYVGTVEALEKEVARDVALKRLASNYHYASTESVETYAYDHFLRCAAPSFATMKGTQDLLEWLSTVLKDPVPQVTRWRKDCYPLIEKTDGAKPDPDYKSKVASFSSDDRDIQAFQDCLKAANEKQRKSLHAPFEQAWYHFAQARDNLAVRFGEFLAR
jgi:hypothetical protein